MDRQLKKTLASRSMHPIWIQERQQTDDGQGGVVDSWINVKQIWAEVSPMQARQVFQYKSVQVDATHLIRIRGLEDLDEKKRLSHNDRIFEILTIENLQERDFEKVITCLERR